MIFEWDEEKAYSNYLKHWVRFEHAAEVWGDPFALEILDIDSSNLENRFILIGFSEHKGFLTIVYCERQDGKVVRIISARKSTKNEKGEYARRI